MVSITSCRILLRNNCPAGHAYNVEANAKAQKPRIRVHTMIEYKDKDKICSNTVSTYSKCVSEESSVVNSAA
jgi:hypothetical protein